MSKSMALLYVLSFSGQAKSGLDALMVKGLVSSVLRSLFGGKIVVFRCHQIPYFKVERTALTEVFVDKEADRSGVLGQQAMPFLFGLCDFANQQAGQWVIVADRRSVALRNIDHLTQMDHEGAYAPSAVEFYWARAGKDDISDHSATPGLWAVRGEHLPLVLERWKEALSEVGAHNASEGEIWTRVVHELPLRKRAFEKGEVVAPRIGAVDWEAVSNAAFVTVPDWPEKEAWKFLQALYFGTYLGDETGMMLNILEA